MTSPWAKDARRAGAKPREKTTMKQKKDLGIAAKVSLIGVADGGTRPKGHAVDTAQVSKNLVTPLE